MRRFVLGTLKVLVPLALGVWLVVYFYRALDTAQREELFSAFRAADLRWLWLSVLLGWFSHVSRAYRWSFLLKHLGYHPRFWSCYHAVMIGYFMNMLLPRAGEASRAVALYRTEGVPFERGFGTILAERAVDTLMLVLIAMITLALQLDKLELFRSRLAQFKAAQEPSTSSGAGWVILLIGFALVLIIGLWLVSNKPAWRARIMDLIRGFGDGLRSVIHTEHKGVFVSHTVLIWSLYVGMFLAGFYCLPTTAATPMAGVLAGFIAGSVAIIVVQGGIGAYPAFVALIVSIYLTQPGNASGIVPEALAMGWLLWVGQTAMIIVLGGLSLLLGSRKKHAQ